MHAVSNIELRIEVVAAGRAGPRSREVSHIDIASSAGSLPPSPYDKLASESRMSKDIDQKKGTLSRKRVQVEPDYEMQLIRLEQITMTSVGLGRRSLGQKQPLSPLSIARTLIIYDK